ncbi:MAG: efflux RND transporter permease subunit, partial [Candidatus Hydrogenedentes bacterium]|nr:efflux RND transporter permease subunit [Candidatus Hydrogenedentota bacterium]
HITLDRIATIHDGFADDDIVTRFNGKNAAILHILKTDREDTLQIDKDVHDYCLRKQRELPEGMQIELWGRFAPLLENRINLLVKNGYSGLLIVFLLLWIFLDIRLSFWTSMNVPLAFAGTFVVMHYYGVTLNMITMFGMVMVLGVVVDNSTIIGEAIYVARKRGFPPVRAAVEGVSEVALPIIASTTTNMVTFVPLLFIPGFVGRLASTLPIVTIAAFTFSLLECLFMFPAHLNHLPDLNASPEKKNALSRMGILFHQYTDGLLQNFIEKSYQPFVNWTIRWRYVNASLAICVLLLAVGMFAGGFVKVDFFPLIDGNSMSAVVEFPSGTTMAVATAAVVRIEEAARRLQDKMETGSGAPLLNNVFSLTGAYLDERGQITLGTHFGSVRVELLDSVDRNIHITQMMAAWEKEIGQINGAIALTIRGDETTSPPGRPVDIWMKGKDLDQLAAAAQELKDKLSTYDGVYQIKDDFRVGKKEINLRLKPEARALGLHTYDLAKHIFTGYFGEELMRVQRGDNNLRIRLRYPEEERTQLSELEKIRIPVSMPHQGVFTTTALNEAKMRHGQGEAGLPALPAKVQEIPLSSVAELEYKAGVSSIQRTNGQRRVAVSAEIDTSHTNSNEIVAELKSGFLQSLVHRHPGITLSFEGEQQDFREALDYLAISYPVALLGVFVLVAASFRSYIQTLVVMIAVPFCAAAALFGHWLFGFDISIMSILGIVALSGVVVNDSIVLVDCVNNYVAEGEDFFQAVARAGSRRFRAIFLTTITTVGGLGPLMLERDSQAQMLIPMALSMSSGVAFGMIVSLLITPCSLCIINDSRRVTHWLIRGHWPTPEEVEPARYRDLIE